MTTTSFPCAAHLRKSIELYILDIYEADGTTLKAFTQWPGYYTLPDKSKIPAVYVVGASMVPSNWIVTGIECTIDDVPEDIKNPGSLGAVVSFERWPVRFTNYGTKQGTHMPLSMLDIRRRVACAFPFDRAIYMARTEVTYEALTVSVLGPILSPPIP